jgi:3-methylcrotonyl-CoA carboxylase alpha subunit
MRERLQVGDEPLEVSATLAADGSARVSLGNQQHSVEAVELDGGELRFSYGGRRYHFHVLAQPGGVSVCDGPHYYSFPLLEEGAAEQVERGDGQLTSQMPGTVLKLLAEPGAVVAKGTPLLILEAMKMEHEVCAPTDGVVTGYPKPAGARVMPGDLLVHFEAS